jgi:hypothetical protein
MGVTREKRRKHAISVRDGAFRNLSYTVHIISGKRKENMIVDDVIQESPFEEIYPMKSRRSETIEDELYNQMAHFKRCCSTFSAVMHPIQHI